MVSFWVLEERLANLRAYASSDCRQVRSWLKYTLLTSESCEARRSLEDEITSLTVSTFSNVTQSLALGFLLYLPSRLTATTRGFTVRLFPQKSPNKSTSLTFGLHGKPETMDIILYYVHFLSFWIQAGSEQVNRFQEIKIILSQRLSRPVVLTYHFLFGQLWFFYIVKDVNY